ncbi:MAG: hypothetical protein ACP5KW_11030, partial [Thermoproteota archaeon]
MDAFKIIKRLFTVLLLLSFFSLIAIPITNLIGVSPPSQLSDIIEFTRLAIVFVFAAIAVIVLIIFGVGYFTLTGWRNYKAIPKLVRLFIALILGYVVFTISGPIAMLIPVPILPIIIATILLWAVLRSISSILADKVYSQKGNVIQIEKAVASAKSFMSKMDPSTREFSIQ